MASSPAYHDVSLGGPSGLHELGVTALSSTPAGELLVAVASPERVRPLVVPITNPRVLFDGGHAALGAPIELEVGEVGGALLAMDVVDGAQVAFLQRYDMSSHWVTWRMDASNGPTARFLTARRGNIRSLFVEGGVAYGLGGEAPAVCDVGLAPSRARFVERVEVDDIRGAAPAPAFEVLE